MNGLEFIGYDSPLGRITIACDGTAVVGLWFDGQKYDREIPGCGPDGPAPEDAGELIPGIPDAQACSAPGKTASVPDETVRWLEVYFSGREPAFRPPVRLWGTPFRRSVWRSLLAVPYGTVITYGELAGAGIGKPSGTGSARAVGGAVGHNPVSLIIPCHRVIGAGGRLTGYAGGLERKARLLELEKSGSANGK